LGDEPRKACEKIQDIVSQSFLHQRVKVADKEDEAAYHKYHAQLVLLHKVPVFATKNKQSTI
jgi:nickel superoxide dismutase